MDSHTLVKLPDLIRTITKPVDISQIPDLSVTGIIHDSRRVQTGYVFVAVSGGIEDGHRYIPEAVQNGAVAVVGTEPDVDISVPYFRVNDSRKALAYLSAGFFNFPARDLVVIGVTGTDGKTTTVNLIFRILQAAGLSVGMISTVNAVIGDKELDTGFHVTTPEAPDIQFYLSQMKAQGLTHVVLEATSHGLEQHRVSACDFDIGVVTNIAHEHLDYHGSFDHYRKAKARLFEELNNIPIKSIASPRGAVLNFDDDSYGYLTELIDVPQVTYGFDPRADIRPSQVAHHQNGISFRVKGSNILGRNIDASITSNLVGEFNLSNFLAAIATTFGIMDLEVEALRKGIYSVSCLPGRMEFIDVGQDFYAIVDFAHTPNALRSVLDTARKLTQGKVIAIFGSAGLRDQAKRRMMAENSAELADLTILTAEDPRTESLSEILSDMAQGLIAHNCVEGQSFWRIPDRREAIKFAVHQAQPGDLVIALGKGHEQSMCFGVSEYAWDDRIAMRAALAELLNQPGPEMPFLPLKW
jgi:UDP-N-acetylmuramoyl-L-alanyl-D-glutamate--2,6-diaminopimelate ligase